MSKTCKLSLPSQCTAENIGEVYERACKIAQQQTDVVLDLLRTQTLDTSALQVLVALVDELRRQGRDVEWTSLPDSALDEITLAGLASHLGLAAD